MALGTFGSALAKTPNAALEIINRGIDRNIDAQKAEYERKKDKINLDQNAYALLRQQGLDDKQARLAARQAIIEKFQHQTESIASKYSNELIQNNAQRLQLGLQQEANKTRISQFMLSMPKKEYSRQSVDQTGGVGPGAGLKQLPAEQANALGAVAGSIKDVDDLMGKWNTLASGTEHVPGAIINAVPVVGGAIQNDAKKYNDARTTAVAHIGRALGEKGVFTEKDAERYYNALPGPLDTKATAEGKISNVKTMIKNDFHSRLDALEGAGYWVSGLRNALKSQDDVLKEIGAIKK